MKFTLKGKSSLLLTLSILLLLSSCATRYKNALFTSKADAVMDTLKTVYVANDKGPEDLYYRIKPGDQISVRNLQNIEFGAQGTATAGSSSNNETLYIIDPEGTVNLPVVGKVQVGGLTRREATIRLQELYSKTLFKDPIIAISIVNLKVTMLGEFNTQGNFLIERDNVSLIEILGQAGGLTEKADPKKIKIIRGDKSNPEIIYVNLKDINSLGNRKLVLQSGDIIYAEPKKIYSSTEGVQTAMSFVQPVVLILNTIVIIYNLSR
ncbi:polysaccharide biosynthesis/export family protein [Desertivirga arenae]|uniref:polysaccharide biosynthesis/export family protein n=1 Tax=Desertivirga arenae TaxID=2810309 RepID=UPI001A95D19C|nr:polysaccharide biosynthesis/export family protein [Pedobacter sp. SYSU D00823]